MADYKTTDRTRPNTPLKLLWFEFLLNPSLLEKHLAEEKPDPSATDLIIQFLANTLSTTNNDQQNSISGSGALIPPSLAQPSSSQPCNSSSLEVGPEETVPPKSNKEETENKKDQALKLLALNVTAYLKWELNCLEKKLTLPMQHILLTELKKTVNEADKNPESLEKSLDEMSPDARFAHILYCCWNIRALVLGSYPSRGQKGLNVQIPGQVDPSAVPPELIDSLMRKLNEQSEQSALFLEEVLQSDFAIRMPLMECFDMVTENTSPQNHQWDKGTFLEDDEIKCEVSYDLGCFYFFQEKYTKANEMFLLAFQTLPKIKDHVFCKLDVAKLNGYKKACSQLLGIQESSPDTPLKEVLQNSVHSGYKLTPHLLMNDNIKREIPLSLRDALEMDVLRQKGSGNDLHLCVSLLNAVRKVVEGKVTLTDCIALIKGNEGKAAPILCEALHSVIPHASDLEKTFLRQFIRMLCTSFEHLTLEFQRAGILNSLFSCQELENFLSNTSRVTDQFQNFSVDQNFTSDNDVRLGQLERELIASQSPSQIKNLVEQLSSRSLKPVWTINQKWELPRSLQSLLKGIPSHVNLDLVRILLAKAIGLVGLKHYRGARKLYKMIEDEVKGTVPRLCRFLGWEMLRLDLLELMPTNTYVGQVQEIIPKANACITAYYQDRDAPPDLSLLELSAASLLNFREWDILCDLEPRREGGLEFCRLLALICRDIYLNKGSRVASRELWELVLPIFAATTTGHKRSLSGLPKESSHAIMSRSSLIDFVKRITDTLAFTVIISCFTKLYKILKDESNGEIFLEYQSLWPSVLSNASAYNMQSVAEALQETLQYALSIHPTHSSWLRTCGDLLYVQGHFAAALKHYLSAAMVSSDYFSQPLPRPLFDDIHLKHMIHCCTKLQCHTQAAVLGQLLEDSNYATIFKSLSERVCNDSCDMYYPFIWDVTLLEFLVNLHARRGEVERRQLVLQCIGHMELNSNNNDEIQREAANLRKGKFLRAMIKQYL